MRRLAGFILVSVFLGCQDPASISEFTGNATTYELRSGSDYGINGTVAFKERIDGFTTVVIQLRGTDGEITHPVHLHLGTLSTPKADIAALLTPVLGTTGKSETLLKLLADETPVNYQSLMHLNACIKVHLSDTGDGRDVILAGGDIGESYRNAISSGRQRGFAICESTR